MTNHRLKHEQKRSVFARHVVEKRSPKVEHGLILAIKNGVGSVSIVYITALIELAHAEKLNPVFQASRN